MTTETVYNISPFCNIYRLFNLALIAAVVANKLPKEGGYLHY